MRNSLLSLKNRCIQLYYMFIHAIESCLYMTLTYISRGQTFSLIYWY